MAATLLDLKAARLLPAGEVEDEEDLALLEARDLLFARLLQYRAYKEVAAVFAGRMAVAGPPVRPPRAARAPVRRAAARGAARPRPGRVRPARRAALAPSRGAQGRHTEHIHTPRDQRQRAGRGIIAALLRDLGRATFRQLTVGLPPGSYEVVAWFLALLDLYRDGNVSFEQLVPLGDLYVTWAGPETGPRIGANEEDDWT